MDAINVHGELRLSVQNAMFTGQSQADVSVPLFYAAKTFGGAIFVAEVATLRAVFSATGVLRSGLLANMGEMPF